MRYSHIFWDFDGTLFNTYPSTAKCFVEFMAARGHNIPEKEIYNRIKITFADAAAYYSQKCGIEHGEIISGVKQLRREREAEFAEPFPGAAEICRAVTENGGENYLYTHRGVSAIALLKLHNMDAFFTDYVTGGLDFPRKPAPDALNYLIEKHRINRADAIMVGDRELDIEAGFNANIHACFFTEGGEAETKAGYIAKYFSDFYEIFLLK